MSIFTRKKTAEQVETKVLDNNQIEAYLDAFMFNNNIDPKMVLVQDISSVSSENGFIIIIKTAFPGALFGKDGNMSTRLAKGLSKTLDCKLKLKII